MVPPKQRLKYGTAEASLSLRDQNRKRRSLSPGSDGSTGISVEIFVGKNDGNRGRARVNLKENPCVVSKLVLLVICVPLATRTRDGSMAAFSLLDQ